MRDKLYAIALALAVAATACGKKNDSAGSAPSGGTEYGCTIFIKKKATGAPVQGQATDPDEAKATEAAWKDACGKLAAADQPDCQNKDKWTAAVSTGSMTMNGKKSSTVTIKLEQNVPQVKGKAKSSTSEDDACKQAVADACKKAGAAGDCLAAGGFEQQGKSTEKTTGGM
jgi:hypothetical protein